MKKFCCLIITLVLVLSLGSCKKKTFDKEDLSNVYCQIQLSTGDKINLKLNHRKAPITVENFIEVVESGYYKNTIFHRVIKDFMIQGGGFYDSAAGPLQKKSPVDAIYGEFSSNGWEKNTIEHDLGVISMARTSAKNSATTQFFLCSARSEHLDGEYAAFGKTTDEQSNQVILEISKIKTYYLSAQFQNYPEKLITIKKIVLSNEKF